MKTKDINERYRYLGQSYHLALDLIQCTPEIKPAVQYAVENTVVCDNMDDARDLCFRRRERAKAVTLDGSVISKEKMMTGGNTARDVDRNRWDEQAHAELKARKEALTAELLQLGRPMKRQGPRHELTTKLALLKNKEEYGVKDIEVTKQKVKGLQKQAKELKQQMAKIEKEKAKLAPAITKRQATIAKLQTKIATSEEEIFRDFSLKTGVANVREFEEGELQKIKESKERCLHCSPLVRTMCSLEH